MITDVNNSVIMTSTVAGYVNKARRGELKDVEPMAGGRRDEGEGGAQADASPIVKYEKIKRLRRRSVYRDDRKNSHAVKSRKRRERERAR